VRIVVWSEYSWPYVGGTEIQAMLLWPELHARGHDVTILSGQAHHVQASTETVSGVRIHRLPLREALASGDPRRVAALCRDVAALRRRAAPDVVVVASLGPLDLFLHESSRSHPAPLVVTPQQDIPPRLLGPSTLPGRTLRAARWAVCCSASIRDEVCAAAPELRSRSSVIYHGLSLPPASGPPPLDPPHLLGIGRLVPFKGFDVALQAFRRVLDRLPRARLTLAGDGPERLALEHLAVRLGVKDAVDFVGWIHPERVAALMATATLVLMPSRWEGLPLVGLEAQAAGRPVVASRVGGLPEVVADGETGCLVAPDSPAALADAAMALLGSPDTLARMGRAARARAARVFDVTRCVDEYEALLAEVSVRTTAA
jgi:glycogen(starch) synthase